MKIEEIENASDAELRQRLVECFDQAQSIDQLAGSILLRKVRFYQDEIERRKRQEERREDGRISNRDYRNEIIIMGMIGLEIVLAVVSLIYTVREGEAQTKILEDLQTSTTATATLLGQELDLEYTLAINVEYDGSDSVRVFNNSRSEAILGGVSVDGVIGKIKDGRPFVIADHNNVLIELTEYDPKLRAKGTASTKPFIFPIEIYISNARGQEVVWKGRVTWGNSSGPLTGTPNGQLVQQDWAPEIKPAVSKVPSANP